MERCPLIVVRMLRGRIVAARLFPTGSHRPRGRAMQQKPISCLSAVAALAILSLAGLPSPAASFDSRHASDLAANPSDLHFRVDTAGGQRAFHIGQRIPLTLAFS